MFHSKRINEITTATAQDLNSAQSLTYTATEVRSHSGRNAVKIGLLETGFHLEIDPLG